MSETTPAKKQEDQLLQIGEVYPRLIDLTKYSRQLVLDGFRLAYKGRTVLIGRQLYIIVGVLCGEQEPHKLFAQLQEVQPD